MASLSLLANDYLALAKEAGRRHAEVREVSYSLPLPAVTVLVQDKRSSGLTCTHLGC